MKHCFNLFKKSRVNKKSRLFINKTSLDRKKGMLVTMEYVLIIVISVLLLLYYNFYLYKRIERRFIIKNMQVDERIIALINDFKKITLKNTEFKNIQNNIRHIKLLTYFFNILITTILLLSPFIFFFNNNIINLNFTSMNIADSLVSSAYVLLIGSFVPIPGASGGIEFGFLNFFNNFLGRGALTAVLIVWRFITYYFGMIIGALAFSLEKKGD